MLKVAIDAQLPEHTLYRYMRSGQPKTFEWAGAGPSDLWILALENDKSQQRIQGYLDRKEKFLLYMESSFWLTDRCSEDFINSLDKQPLCLGVASHTRRTLDEFAVLLPRKPTFHVPVGVPRQHDFEVRSLQDPITFLFWGSHNDKEQKAWKDRGGNLVDRMFGELHSKFPCRLVLRAPADAGLWSEHLWLSDVERHEGYVSDAVLDDIHRRSDVLLLPSSKAHFISVPYAASFGIPTVGLEHWALRELIEDGMNGIIAKDFDDLVARCSQLPELLPALSRGALERQRRDHDCERYPERWAKVFEELHL